ncbi:MAG TPA: hypothetical protein DCM05_07030 [Elusimicrobia bacterium]|nr:hypothetical protein [Elusimicrobiota bacterium]
MRPALFAAGFFFAVLQFSYYLLLEWRLSSAWTTYALLTLGWLAGVWAGLRLKPGRDLAFLAASLGAYGLLSTTSGWSPFDDRLRPLFALCAGLSGAHAGTFFRTAYARLQDARSLLLHENNGFLVGLLAGFLGFYGFGWTFSLWAPPAAALLLAGLRRRA